MQTINVPILEEQPGTIKKVNEPLVKRIFVQLQESFLVSCLYKLKILRFQWCVDRLDSKINVRSDSQK